MLGAAQLACTYAVDGGAPQFCSFSWSLAATGGTVAVAQGSFSIAPGTENASVYQSAGIGSALGDPVLFCQPLAPTAPALRRR